MQFRLDENELQFYFILIRGHLQTSFSHVNTTFKWEDREFCIYLPALGDLSLFIKTWSRVGSKKKEEACHQSAMVVKRKSNLLH